MTATKTKTKTRSTGARSLAGAIVNLKLADIAPHPANPRGDWDNAKIPELAGSLGAFDLLQPIVVRKVDGARQPYQLIVGERRFRAAKLAGWQSIPAKVVNADNTQALEMVGQENLQRLDWSVLELARYLKALNQPVEKGGAGMICSAIGERFAKSEAWANNLIRLLELPEELLAKVADGTLPPSAARGLLGYRNQPDVMHAIIADIEANPEDWRRRDDVERQAAFIANQVTAEDPAGDVGDSAESIDADDRGQSGPSIDNRPRPAGDRQAPADRPAITARTVPAAAEPEPEPTLKRSQARELLEPYADNEADLLLLREVALELLQVLRQR